MWVPTARALIRRLLQLADTTKDDVVLDLGSSDGRIPIYAAKHFGAQGIGVELETNLSDISTKSRARARRGAPRRGFLQQDLFEVRPVASSRAVVTLPLSAVGVIGAPENARRSRC